MDQIARLRNLLGIAEDRETVEELGERVIDRELRARDVAEVLPEAVSQAEREGRLTPSLEAPIEQTLRKSITRDPKAFADILFPVMGPAIRRSIADALRSALEGLNRALELGLSARAMRWRLEAWRTGVPFREVVLRHTMAYRVREAFLISKHNGLLMVRAGDPGSEALDRDAVAAMLTAIEDFVADSTGGPDQGELVSAELGGHVLWVIPGYAARLALVVEGQPPRSVRVRLQEILERIHRRFGSWMQSFDGTLEPEPELIGEVGSCLMQESLESDAGPDQRKGRAVALTVLSLLALVLLAWAAWSVVDHRREAARWALLKDLLAARPGLVYVGEARAGDARRVVVLADPLAESPASLALEAGYDPGRIQWSIHRFWSAEPELVATRLRRALAPVPDGISIDAADGVVTVQGEAPAGWIGRLRQYVALQSAPEQIRLGSLRESGEGLETRLRSALAPPAGVEIALSGGATLSLAGVGSGRWRSRAEAVLERDFPQLEADWSAYRDARVGLEAARQALVESAVVFAPGQTSGPTAALEPIAAVLEEIDALAPHCDCRIELAAVGCSDGSGPSRVNVSIRRARASWLRDAVLAIDPDAGPVVLDTDCAGGNDIRRAYLRLRLSER